MTPPIRTLIVDDEPAARAAIRTLLAGETDIEIVGECADGRAAVESIRALTPDLLFLDVQMPELDGFAVLRSIDAVRRPVVVFVTAYDRYALDAFHAHALDYLLKPYGDDRFHDALARARQQVRQGALGALSDRVERLLAELGGREGAPEVLQRIVIKADGRVTVLPVADVDWIEADGDYVRIHAGAAAHVLRQTMKQLESQLDAGRFVRIHRSIIVNVERIKELQPYFRGEYVVILKDGARLKLSRGFREHLERALGSAI